jgi:hypothetical protein
VRDEGEYLKSFSVLSAQGGAAFGATTRRFTGAGAPAIGADDGCPGPGSYADGILEDSAVGGDDIAGGRRSVMKVRRGATSSFKSKTQKEIGTLPAKEERPPPGAYDPKSDFETGHVVRVPGRGEGFLTATDRFRDKKDLTGAPGPGQYNTMSKTAPKSFNRLMTNNGQTRGRVSKMGFNNTEDRFNDAAGTTGGGRHANRTGPGDYDIQKPWVTRTYNCLFGEVI